jgi:hypothetical protein
MADQDPPQEENKNGGRPRRQRDREDQVPVEELFDLSKPIPRVRRFTLFLFNNRFLCMNLSHIISSS